MTQHRLEVADVFRQHEQEFMAQWGHTLSRQQRRVFRDICACRTPALGAHIEQCDTCRQQTIAYNSCRSRFCPKCQSTARDKWLTAQSKQLLPVPYCHVVFTLPHELSPLALQNPKLMYGLLFRAVSETLLTIAADPRRLGAQIGYLAVLHTWSQKMLHHPHLHCLVPAGGRSLDRSRWIACRGRFFLPVAVLKARFRRRFLRLLAAAYRQGKLKLWGRLGSLRKPEAFDRFLRPLQTKKWVVCVKPPFGSAEHVLKYLAHYTHRIAISNGRLIAVENGQVTFRWRDSADHNAQKSMTLEAVEFIRRFLMHVLPAGFVKIRHCGLLANRHCQASLALCRSLLHSQQNAAPQLVTELHLRAVRRNCPVCQRGTLHIIGWFPPGAVIPPVLPVNMDSS
ncbi:MAG TPA: IS91 family transposase [Candidatus Sulfotelmatobacter sp.]